MMFLGVLSRTSRKVRDADCIACVAYVEVI
jgi:hypothetical protein